MVTEPSVLLLIYGIAVVAFVVFERRRLSAVIRSVGRPAAYFLVISVSALLIAQTYLPDGSLYPFTSWTMYTGNTPSRTTWQMEFVRQSGDTEAIQPARLLPGPNPRALWSQLANAASRVARADSLTRAERERDLDLLLAGMVQLDSLRSSDPARFIRIRECTIEGAPPWTKDSFVCTTLIERDVQLHEWPHAP